MDGQAQRASKPPTQGSSFNVYSVPQQHKVRLIILWRTMHVDTESWGRGFNPTSLRQPVEIVTLTLSSRKCGDLSSSRHNVAVSWSGMESCKISPVPGPCRFCSFQYIPSDTTGSPHHFPKNIVLTHLECSNSLRMQLLVVRWVTCYCESAFDRS